MPDVEVEHAPDLIGQGPPDSRERALLRETLEFALKDLFRTAASTKSLRQETHDWVFGEPSGRGRWPYGDFASLCEALGIDPDALREQLRRDLEKQGGTS